MQQGLFRQVALDRLPSPDQLDRLMRVTNPKSWLALATLAALTLAVVIWSLFGSVSTSVRAPGVVIREGGNYIVRANTTGRLADLHVKRGDLLSQGQVVATLAPEAGVTTPVISPFTSAQVVEILASKQDRLTPDTPIAAVELVDEELHALLYVPAATAARVRPGMPVQLSPASARRDGFGFIQGRVRTVAQFPSTQRGMTAILGNESLVQHFLAASGGAPVEIEVELLLDRTPSGFKWSTSDGPPTQIPSGTLSQADVVLMEQRPISLVLPILQ